MKCICRTGGTPNQFVGGVEHGAREAVHHLALPLSPFSCTGLLQLLTQTTPPHPPTSASKASPRIFTFDSATQTRESRLHGFLGSRFSWLRRALKSKTTFVSILDYVVGNQLPTASSSLFFPSIWCRRITRTRLLRM